MSLPEEREIGEEYCHNSIHQSTKPSTELMAEIYELTYAEYDGPAIWAAIFGLFAIVLGILTFYDLTAWESTRMQCATALFGLASICCMGVGAKRQIGWEKTPVNKRLFLLVSRYPWSEHALAMLKTFVGERGEKILINEVSRVLSAEQLHIQNLRENKEKEKIAQAVERILAS